MFLDYLSDTNKANFIELAYKLAYSNKEFPEAQRKLLGRYKEKCGISYIPNTTTAEALIAGFGEQNDQVKRIVYFEIYMLLASDEEIDADETKVLGELRSAFGLSDEEAERIQQQGLAQKQAVEDLKNSLRI